MPKPEQQPIPLEQQYAALCYRLTSKGKLRFLLITSRGIGRWIVPKGWPMRGRKPWEAAQVEAWEEAGVRGTIYRECVGRYDYQKWRDDAAPLHCRVHVYPLNVSSLADRFPEAGQRERQWVSAKEAADLVAERDLARILTAFSIKSLKTTAN